MPTIYEHEWHTIAALRGIPREAHEAWTYNVRQVLHGLDVLTAIAVAPTVMDWFTDIAKDPGTDTEPKALWDNPFGLNDVETRIVAKAREQRWIDPNDWSEESD